MVWQGISKRSRKMRWIRAISLGIAVLIVEMGLGRRWGQIPPLGRFFSPVEGFWRNAEPEGFRPPAEIHIPSLQAPVVVLWDKRWVPHIYAQNEADLYRVQGYLQAYLRLWQMEIQSDAAAGRLSRILGEVTLAHDRAMRRLGLPYAAERAYQAIMSDSLSRAVLEAFTEGVNAYISQLHSRDYPVEYKLLDYAPEPWTPMRSVYLVKYMAYDLSVRSPDKYLTALLPRIGKGAIDTLYPNQAPIGHTTILSLSPIPEREVPPQPPVYYSETYLQDTAALELEEAPSWVGSNNWAVSGKKTATGYPLLANDPHLGLNLPSIWVEMHLVAPSLNTYGVTLLGSPGIIIGYNAAIAWGVTNVGPDAFDFYHVRYADKQQRSIYVAGQVVALSPRAETLWVRQPFGGQKLLIDTVWYSPWGPIVHRSGEDIPRPLAGKAREVPIDCALRWISYEPSNEARCFYELNHASNLEGYKRALQYFGSPAQNFVYADTAGHIALWVRGFYPLRWKDQGKFVLEAERPEHHWKDWLSFEENPHTIDPPEGFVRSANSYPAGRAYPYYLGWYFALPDRAARIEERLRSMEKATVDSMRLLQLDVESYLARRALPIMLSYAEGEKSPWIDTLKRWDYRFTAEGRAPTLFRRWWKAFHGLLWQELHLRLPEWEITLKLLEEVHKARLSKKPSPHPRWLRTDDTSAKSLKRLLLESWRATAAWADQAGDSLIWWRYRGTRLRHMARLPGFGSDVIRADGDAQCVNAIGPTAGPSWRMVVSLKPPVQGYGVYPGGQSGNPGSFHYIDFLPGWEKGELYPHAFYPSAETFPDSLVIQRTTAQRGND
ncbi:MAG: penicillin acylase family protein [Bacteroidia bacterium]|nr:penicillin acylase family protein [Bacteroidia bacterium]MDW8057423.1 penicillin acylase family protein [Bacteroidia bacterium]